MSEDLERRGLGRGLKLLMGPMAVEAELIQLPVGTITPGRFQPRQHFDAKALAELTESIRLQGVVQPVIVRPVSDGYELIAGERRWRAAQAAGLATLPAVVREGDDTEALMLALVENVTREDLSPIEEARGYVALMEEFNLSLGDIAIRVGRSKSSVSNRIRLLELPDDVIDLIEQRKLSEGHARAVLAVPDHEERRRFAIRIVRRGLSVRAAERAAKLFGARQHNSMRKNRIDPALISRACGLLEHATGVPVRSQGSSLTIQIVDETSLSEIVESLERCIDGFSRED